MTPSGFDAYPAPVPTGAGAGPVPDAAVDPFDAANRPARLTYDLCRPAGAGKVVGAASATSATSFVRVGTAAARRRRRRLPCARLCGAGCPVAASARAVERERTRKREVARMTTRIWKRFVGRERERSVRGERRGAAIGEGGIERKDVGTAV